MGNLPINRELKNIDDDVSARVSKIRQLSQQQRDLKISSAQDKNVARILINELGGCKGDLERKETALDNLTGLDDTQKSTRKNLLRQIGSAVSDIDASVCFLQAAIATFDNIQTAKEEATKQAQAAKEKQEKATREEKAAEAKKRQEREAQQQASASSSSQPAGSSHKDQEADSQQKKQDEDSDENLDCIQFGPDARQEAVSIFSRKLLARAARESNNPCIYITSTARTPERQAHVMFTNLEKDVAEQRATYKAPGQAVIDVYVEMKALQCGSEVIKQAMVAKIHELGPSNVSNHCLSDFRFLNVVDVARSRLSDPELFKQTIKAYSLIQKVLDENKAIHVEIQQP